MNSGKKKFLFPRKKKIVVLDLYLQMVLASFKLILSFFLLKKRKKNCAQSFYSD